MMMTATITATAKTAAITAIRRLRFALLCLSARALALDLLRDEEGAPDDLPDEVLYVLRVECAAADLPEALEELLPDELRDLLCGDEL